jgi:hypothetical protein
MVLLTTHAATVNIVLLSNRHGEDFYTVHAEGLKHTRMPAGAAVSIASTSAAVPSFSDMEDCYGTCDAAGNCNLQLDEATCCKEVLKYGTQYGYGAIPSYGYDEYDKDDGYSKSEDYKGDGYGKDNGYGYGKDDGYGKGDGYGKDDGYGKGDGYGKDDGYGKGEGYGKSDGYGKGGGGRKNKYDYDVYTAADKSGKASAQQAKQTGKASTQAEVPKHIPMISCFEGEY